MSQFTASTWGRVAASACTRLSRTQSVRQTPLGRHSHSTAPPALSLADILLTKIQLNGPLSVADYMREALVGPRHGYYMGRDVFGAAGDFITSPEISQVFGELIGAWCVGYWQQLGSPKAVNVVELGPGRGTLAADALRVMAQFGMAGAAELHLLEASPHLRGVQAATLGCAGRAAGAPSSVERHGVKTQWHNSFAEVPRGRPLFIIAHEFFDALPIHQFSRTKNGWRERVITADLSPERKRQLMFADAPGATLASMVYVPRALGASGETGEPPQSQHDVVEFSPASWTLTDDISKALAVDGGVALIIDYGTDGPNGDTLRGYSRHAQVHPLDDPGKNDITADVNFAVLRDSVIQSSKGKVCSYGPVTQRDFLLSLGLEHRARQLVRSAGSDSAAARAVVTGCRRLVDAGDMGARFKAFAIAPAEQPVPPAFATPVARIPACPS